MKPPKWEPGSFLDNFNAAVEHLGYDHIPVAYGLARVNWPDITTRDLFYKMLTLKRSA